jgi:hypothetical protein
LKTGSVQVKFADGSERTLPIHGITQLQFVQVLDEVGVKSFDALKSAEPTLEMIRTMTRVVALALTFEKPQDAWSVERITSSFADMEQVCKAFLKCLALSPLPQAPKTQRRREKQTPYQ